MFGNKEGNEPLEKSLQGIQRIEPQEVAIHSMQGIGSLSPITQQESSTKDTPPDTNSGAPANSK